MAKRWTEEEIIILKEVYEHNSKEIILSKVQKPWLSIRQKATDLGLHRDELLINEDRKIRGPRKDSWTIEEDNILKEIYEYNTKEVILLKFNRSWQSIFIRAKSLGLNRDPEIIKQEMINGGKEVVRDTDWSIAEDNLLKSFYQDIPRDIILSKINRTWKAIRGRAAHFSLSRNKNLIKKENVEGTKKAMMAKYGVEYSTLLPSMHEKSRQTNLRKRGVEYALSSPDVREKINKTVKDRYGVDNVFQLEETKEKSKQTNLDKYGVENPLQNKEIMDRVKGTNLDRYGVDNPFKMVDRVQEGMIKKYGEKTPLKIPELIEKKKQTNIERYGVPYSQQTQEVKDKIEATNLEKYGTKSPLQNKEVKQKIKATNIDKYGVPYPAQAEEVKNKIIETNLKIYGVKSLLELKEIRDKAYKNKTFTEHNTSKEEDKFFEYLKIIDVNTKQHVNNPIVNGMMDFYMPQFDMWIQYDGIYWHGKIKRDNISRRSLKIAKTVESDKYQNENVPNLIRFWSDEVSKAIVEDTIIDLIVGKIGNKLKELGLIL